MGKSSMMKNAASVWLALSIVVTFFQSNVTVFHQKSAIAAPFTL
jgi:hypothetical protein